VLNSSALKLSRKCSAGPQDDEVAEDDACDEQDRHQDQERRRHATLRRAEGGQDEGVDLVEDHGRRDDHREVGGVHQRGGECLRRAQRDRVDLLPGRLIDGQRVVHDLEDVVVLPDGQHPRDHERQDGDDQPAAKLVEMVDDGQPVLMPDGPDAPHCLRGSRC
jgi:hypothetical protein